MRRQGAGHGAELREHELVVFAHGVAADAVAGQVELDDALHRLEAQVLEDAALHDAE